MKLPLRPACPARWNTRLRKTLAPLAILVGTVLLSGCLRVAVHGDPEAYMDNADSRPGQTLRVATYNTSLYEDEAGGLVRRLAARDPEARRIAAVLQRTRPDVVLLNEFDYDADGEAAELFQRNYLEIAQPEGGQPLRYPYRYFAPVNTGVPSGLDLDGNGEVGGAGRERGNDAWGYGLHPGQYGMLVLSRHPIEADGVRTFQQLRWSAMPGARRPVDPVTGAPWYAEPIWTRLRLSSKSHWDVPIRSPLGTVHVLAAHPTPPVFDGPENRNGLRNADEIRFWADYVDPAPAPWICDDRGRCGGLAEDASFVVVGDYNADPSDGDGVPGAIAQLLDHPRINADFVPRSEGAAQRAAERGVPRDGDVATHTGDFGPKAGTLRLDYVLPSADLRAVDGGVFWPRAEQPEAGIAGASDHHLVWLDLKRPE